MLYGTRQTQPQGAPLLVPHLRFHAPSEGAWTEESSARGHYGLFSWSYLHSSRPLPSPSTRCVTSNFKPCTATSAAPGAVGHPDRQSLSPQVPDWDPWVLMLAALVQERAGFSRMHLDSTHVRSHVSTAGRLAVWNDRLRSAAGNYGPKPQRLDGPSLRCTHCGTVWCYSLAALQEDTFQIPGISTWLKD